MTIYARMTKYGLALERQRAARECDRDRVREIDREYRARAGEKPRRQGPIRIEFPAERRT